jgi:hypothetical protein
VIVEAEGINEKLEVSAYRNGNTLVIDSADKLKDIAKQSLGTLTIYLPEELILDEAKISVGAGTLYIESIDVNDFSVDVGAGAANIDFFHKFTSFYGSTLYYHSRQSLSSESAAALLPQNNTHRSIGGCVCIFLLHLF